MPRLPRLKKRADFLAIAAARKSVATPSLVLQSLAAEPGGRIGFTVTKKVGNSVVRNRAKRRLRAAADQILPLHAAAGYDYVLIGRDGTGTRPWPSLIADLEGALRRLRLWRDAA